MPFNGEILKVLRKKNHLSQALLAEFLEIDVNHLKMIENYQATLTTTMLSKLSDFFAVDKEAFFKDSPIALDNISSRNIPQRLKKVQTLEVIASIQYISSSLETLDSMV